MDKPNEDRAHTDERIALTIMKKGAMGMGRGGGNGVQPQYLQDLSKRMAASRAENSKRKFLHCFCWKFSTNLLP
jgi:hypothetical protein